MNETLRKKLNEEKVTSFSTTGEVVLFNSGEKSQKGCYNNCDGCYMAKQISRGYSLKDIKTANKYRNCRMVDDLK